MARASQRFWKLEAEEHRMFLQKCECAQGLLNPFLGLTCREQVQGTEDRLSPLSSSFARTLTGPNQWSNLDGWESKKIIHYKRKSLWIRKQVQKRAKSLWSAWRREDGVLRSLEYMREVVSLPGLTQGNRTYLREQILPKLLLVVCQAVERSCERDNVFGLKRLQSREETLKQSHLYYGSLLDWVKMDPITFRTYMLNSVQFLGILLRPDLLGSLFCNAGQRIVGLLRVVVVFPAPCRWALRPGEQLVGVVQPQPAQRQSPETAIPPPRLLCFSLSMRVYLGCRSWI